MNTLLDLINSLSSHQWFLIGGLIASIPGTIAIVEWIKRHHYKVKAEKLWSGFVVLNVAFWGTVLTAADAVLANFSQITHIGSLVPQIAPWVSVWGPRVSVTVLVAHTVASSVKKWWVDRKAKRPLFAASLPDLKPLVEQVSSPISTPISDITAPPQDVFNV